MVYHFVKQNKFCVLYRNVDTTKLTINSHLLCQDNLVINDYELFYITLQTDKSFIWNGEDVKLYEIQLSQADIIQINKQLTAISTISENQSLTSVVTSTAKQADNLFQMYDFSKNIDLAMMSDTDIELLESIIKDYQKQVEGDYKNFLLSEIKEICQIFEKKDISNQDIISKKINYFKVKYGSNQTLAH